MTVHTNPRSDSIVLVDAYNLNKHLPQCRAERIRDFCKFFGRNIRCKAILSMDDSRGLTNYQQARFETVSMNGDRSTELVRYIGQLKHALRADPPQQLVVITNDPYLVMLLDQAIEGEQTSLSVWTFGSKVSLELAEYNYRQLDEVLPDIRQARVDVRIDYENIAIGLQHRGWNIGTENLIATIKNVVVDLGEIASITAYADWTRLSQNAGRDIQRELALAGVEPRYQVSLAGKNSADMKIADDIRTLVDKGDGAPDAVDVVVLVTGDRDFRPVVERAKACGKRVVILALEGSLSWELRQAASEVRLLDAHFRPTQSVARRGTGFDSITAEQICLLFRIEVWLREHQWKFAFPNELHRAFGANPVNQLIEAGLLVRHPRAALDANHRSRGDIIVFSPDIPLVQAIRHISHWLPHRVSYLLRDKKMQYVDSNYLAGGMARNVILINLGIGQTRAEVEKLLDCAAVAGLVVKKVQSHPKNPAKTITTWWLPKQAGTDLVSETVTNGESNTTEPSTANKVGSAESGGETLGQGSSIGHANITDDKTLASDSSRSRRSWPSPSMPITQAA